MQNNESFRLVVRRGPQPNQVFELNKDVITLGRDITNDIVINDPEASRHHLRITRGVSGYNIEDLGSTNGTFIGGQRVSGVRELKRGDMIGLGETVTLGYEVVRPSGGAGAAPSDADPAASPYSRPQDGQDAGTPPPPTPAPQQPSAQPQDQQQYGQTQDYYNQQGQQPAPAPQQGQPQPAQQSYGTPQPEYGQQGYGQQPQTPGYDYDPYDVRQEEGGSAFRWIMIGCGLLFVFCCCSTTIGLVFIDALDLWNDLPIIRDLAPLFEDIAGALGLI